MNYLYSLIKRAGIGVRLIGALMLIPILVCFGTYSLIEKYISEQLAIAVFILLFGFIIVFPIFYAIYPGYRYLKKVECYSVDQALLILIAIVLGPPFILVLIYSW